MSKYILGVDTSCYTTSIAIIDEDRNLLYDERKVLDVKKGNRGLRQSEGVFQHMKNFPALYEGICQNIDAKKITKVCCSNKPRNLENSYMPVFLAGASFGKTIADTLNVSYEEFSHQEGHIEAAKWSSESLKKDEFIALHISGGTTELLKVSRNKNKYQCEIIGGTKDISAGQLIDRIGASMGLDFPAGKELDRISENGVLGRLRLPVSTKGTNINFSGAETYVMKILENGSSKNRDIAKALFECIYKSFLKIILEAASIYRINEILIVGGVASNTFLRDNLYRGVNALGINIHFGKTELCTDNAVGTALLGTYSG